MTSILPNQRLTARFVGSLAALALFMGACGSDEGSDADSESTEQPESESTEQPESESTEQPDDASGGDDSELIISIGSEPGSLDPHALTAGTDEVFALNVFERLLERDVDGKQVPGIATEYSVSEDGTEFTFELREGVKFHNGDTVTAEDVKYSFESFVDPELGNTFAYLLRTFESAEIVDEDTVIIHLTEYDAKFLPGGAFARIVPKNFIEENGREHFAENPVGTGPLKFVDRKIRESFTLERFDDYWGEAAGYERYEFRIAPDANARVSALRSGEVDLISQVPPQNLEQLQNETGLKVEKGYTADNVWVKFGTIEGDVPWGDARVREAMDLAIDKEAIVEEIQNNLGLFFAGVAPLNGGFDRVDYEQRPYDPDRARELLAEAGYADGFDIGMTTPVNGRLPASEQTFQAIAGFWSEIGINANVEVIEYSQWVQSMRRESALEGVTQGLHGDYNTYDPQDRMQTHFPCDAPYGVLCDPVFDEMLEAVASTVDATPREDVYIDAFRYLYIDQTHFIPLYSSQQAYAMADDVCWIPRYGNAFVDAARADPC